MKWTQYRYGHETGRQAKGRSRAVQDQSWHSMVGQLVPGSWRKRLVVLAYAHNIGILGAGKIVPP